MGLCTFWSSKSVKMKQLWFSCFAFVYCLRVLVAHRMFGWCDVTKKVYWWAFVFVNWVSLYEFLKIGNEQISIVVRLVNYMHYLHIRLKGSLAANHPEVLACWCRQDLIGLRRQLRAWLLLAARAACYCLVHVMSDGLVVGFETDEAMFLSVTMTTHIPWPLEK